MQEDRQSITAQHKRDSVLVQRINPSENDNHLNEQRGIGFQEYNSDMRESGVSYTVPTGISQKHAIDSLSGIHFVT
jgi:hypothetical protein